MVKLHPKAALDFAVCSLLEVLVPLLVSVPFLTLFIGELLCYLAPEPINTLLMSTPKMSMTSLFVIRLHFA